MNKVNYQKQLDELLWQLPEKESKKKLLLHSCCAPCSSYVLEYLRQYFDITVLYYNPNITEREEYEKRAAEQKRLIREMNEEADGDCKNRILAEEGRYDPERFFAAAKGLELVPEGGERCFKCFGLRLEHAARLAKEGGYDYFTTTLTISPMKNAARLNDIGLRMAELYGVPYLVSDFKKKNGYKRSVELSGEYGLYRQDYCGCVYSRAETGTPLHESL